MKKYNWIFGLLLFAATAVSFASCDDDDDKMEDKPEIETPDKPDTPEVPDSIENRDSIFLESMCMYILNEGSMGLELSSVAKLQPDDSTATAASVIYRVGDTGNDIATDGTSLYVADNTLGRVAKIDGDGNELASALLPSPRYLLSHDGSLYASSYNGYLYKLDADNLAVADSVALGLNPEEIALLDGKIVVANSGWGMDSTLSVVDIATFAVEKEIKVIPNCNRMVACGGSLFVQSLDAVTYAFTTLQRVNLQSGQSETIGYATAMTPAADGKLYYANCETDWNTWQTVTTFSSYDVANGTTGDLQLSGAPQELFASTVYMMQVAPDGHLYVGTTNYYSEGVIYRFDADGTFVRSYTSGGISPNGACFLSK